jgi:hypothetical protein
MPLLEDYKKNSKNKFCFLTCKHLFAKKSGTRTFSPAARGSGGEQVTPISNIKFEKSLTHPSMVKV